MTPTLRSSLAACAVFCLLSTAHAQEAPPDPAPAADPAAAQGDPAGAGAEGDPSAEDLAAMGPMAQLGWIEGPTEASLGPNATVKVPEGYLFIDGGDTRKFLELLGNIAGTQEVGMLLQPEEQWFVVFEFDPVGYVEDDDKDDLDPDDVLESMRESNEAGNEVRKERGLTTLTITGWATKPHYDEASNYLEWAIELEDDATKGRSVNHQTRLLGRRGIMKATLVIDPPKLAGALPTFRELLADFDFKEGERYAEYKDGDKIAEYGLTGLMVGGAAVLAAKSGLLKSIWKFLVFIVAGIGVGLKKLFGRGGGES